MKRLQASANITQSCLVEEAFLLLIDFIDERFSLCGHSTLFVAPFRSTLSSQVTCDPNKSLTPLDAEYTLSSFEL